MKKGKVSIIVPVYNVSNYLNSCIDSILAQSYQDFELILVNDGSTDDSGIICDEYQSKDCRVKVFHTSNHGVSHARNSGLRNASGEYITFIDSDDYIDANYLESYLQYKKYDCVIGSYQTFPIVQKHIHQEMFFSKSDNNLSALSEHVAQIDGTSCCKLYHYSIIKEHNISFNENMRFSEDTNFCLNYLRYANTIKTISNNGYHYRVSEGSQVERKYHLSKEEIDFNLNILLNDYQELEKIWNVTIDHSNFRIGVACYPIENIYSLQSDKDYFELYHTFYYKADKASFYKDPICSPYVRTITAIKYYYGIGERRKGKQLLRDFASFYGREITKIDYPYPFYKTFSRLIGYRQFYVAGIIFSIYLKAKKIVKR